MNADERRSSERAAGWCRPGGATASAVCGICGSDSCRSLSEHGRAEWRFARSAGTGGFPRRPWCSPTGASGRLGGWLCRVGAGCRGRGCFSRNCATTLAPAGQAPLVGFGTGEGTTRRKDRHRSRRTWICEIAQRPSRRARYGRGHDTGKDRHRSWRTCFLRNRATTLPPAQAPLAGFDTGGGTTRGRTGTGRGGRGFCEIAQQPSRRGRLLPLGSLRTGSPPRGTTGAGRRGRDFCEIAQRPYRRGRLLPLGSLRTGARPRGSDRHRPRRTWFLRNCATTPWVKRPRAYLGSSAREHAIGRVPRRHARCNSPSPGCGRGPPAAVGMGRGGAGGGGWPARDRPWW